MDFIFACHATPTQHTSVPPKSLSHQLSAHLFTGSLFSFLIYLTLCTLLSDLDLPAAKVGLLDVLDAEVGVAL